jgi:predicted HicB family RNase H-like nuclease
MPRVYISVYFKNGDAEQRKKRDVTVAFSSDDILYERCKNLSSSEIKKIVGIRTYKELKNKASRQDRSINNYIKSKLRTKLFGRNE